MLALFVALGVWAGTYRYFTAQELQRAEARMSLYHSTVLSEIERFEHLTQVLAVDPFVFSGLQGDGLEDLNERLNLFAGAAGLDAIYVMEPNGLTIAASNADEAGSFVGQSYDFRPYFQTALNGGTGTFYGIGATTGLPGYFIADPVLDDEGEVIGVVALKLNLAPFEQAWRDAGEQVFLTDQHDVVLLASDSTWRYRALDPLSEEERARIEVARQFPGQALEALDWNAEAEPRWAEIDGSWRLHVVNAGLPHSWQLHYLRRNDSAVLRAWLATGAFFAISALGLLFAQYQRGRRLGQALRRSEEEEVQLRRANAALAREIEERRRTEMRLEETRGELERASRLAALGKLSASVTHELGQPIAAMRNQLAAHEIKHSPSKLTQTIGGLVDRMEGIARDLKFFARSRSEPFEDVDLRECADAALELMIPGVEAFGVTVSHERPEAPITVRGSRLRLEQVLTNIMRNAVDAMEDAEHSMLEISYGAEGEEVWVEVADTGSGLGDATLVELREPFMTTRASGQGMGLGLAISSGIMDDHGGRLDARNRQDKKGAVFRMVLSKRMAEEVAAQ
ncbi:sensor histidine kinase [Gymnodinialimonas hymeniacidonis]|uniref:sensor histidine kinase n=1 Tax=Gymnodinialimonas hymeniacidonis TaxID=3126508 RepID=UPI0034C66D9E